MRAVGATLVAMLAATALIACGGGDDDTPETADVPEGAVAVVGDGEISREELEERVETLRQAQPQADGEDGDEGDEDQAAERQLEQQALSALLLEQAIEQEAAGRGVEVSIAEVRQRWRSAAADQFRTKRALRRFLGGQSERDVLDQLRLQTLTQRIHEQIAEQAGGGKDGAKAVREFQREFQQRWRERTACREDLQAGVCAND
jgi:hypothetical protein